MSGSRHAATRVRRQRVAACRRRGGSLMLAIVVSSAIIVLAALAACGGAVHVAMLDGGAACAISAHGSATVAPGLTGLIATVVAASAATTLVTSPQMTGAVGALAECAAEAPPDDPLHGALLI